MSGHYTWLFHRKICPSRWRFRKSFLTASKPSRRSIPAAKKKRKGEKRKAKKKIQNSKSPNFDFSACPSQNVIKRDAIGENGKLSCHRCIFDQIKANVVEIQQEKRQNVQKTRLVQKAPGFNGLIKITWWAEWLVNDCRIWKQEIVKLFLLGIYYTSAQKLQWSLIKKVLGREVKHNIQWLFKRTRVLTFRWAHLSFYSANCVFNFSDKLLGIIQKLRRDGLNLLPKNNKLLEQTLGKSNVLVHYQSERFQVSETVAFLPTSHPIESRQIVLLNFSTNHGNDLETDVCVKSSKSWF